MVTLAAKGPRAMFGLSKGRLVDLAKQAILRSSNDIAPHEGQESRNPQATSPSLARLILIAGDNHDARLVIPLSNCGISTP